MSSSASWKCSAASAPRSEPTSSGGCAPAAGRFTPADPGRQQRAPWTGTPEAITLHTAEEDKTVTEAEWLACADPTRMLEFLRGKINERKLRLFSCACCRR